MKTASSFHGGVAHSSAAKPGCPRARVAKQSRSFHSGASSRDAPPPRRSCDVHPEVSLGRDGGEEACPKCAIRLMKLAAATLEQRAAELERQRGEKEAAEKARRKRRKERTVASSQRDKGQEGRRSEKEGGARPQHGDSIHEMIRWSKGFEYGSASPRPCPPRRGRFSIGQVARPSQIDEPSSRSDVLIQIARLREGDGAWVKRSADVWTYAVLKSREGGPDAALVFAVNERGSSKTFPVTQWAKFVRLVAEESDDLGEGEEGEEREREETASTLPTTAWHQEIERMLSDSSVSENADIKKNKGGAEELPAPARTARPARGKIKDKIRSAVVVGHDVSMYTFGLDDGEKSLDTLVSEPTTAESADVPTADDPRKSRCEDTSLRKNCSKMGGSRRDHGFERSSQRLESEPNAGLSLDPSPRGDVENNMGNVNLPHGHDVSMHTFGFKDEHDFEMSLDTLTSELTAGSDGIPSDKDHSSRRKNKNKGSRKVPKDRGASKTISRSGKRDLRKCSGSFATEPSLDSLPSEPTAGSDDIPPSKDLSSRRNTKKGGDSKSMDRGVSKNTSGSGEHEIEKQSGSPLDSSSRRNVEKKIGSVALKDLEVSLYYKLGVEDEEKELELYSTSSQLQGEDTHVDSSGIREACETIAKYKPKRHVSFMVPQGAAARSRRDRSRCHSSMTPISESSSLGLHEGGKKEADQNGSAGAPRANSLPETHLTREQYIEINKGPKRRPLRRVSLTEMSESDVEQLKEEIMEAGGRKPRTRKPMTLSPNAQKKLAGLNIGDTDPKHCGHVKQESFYSALKSIHRRSSVMVPPSSSVALDLS